MDANSNLKKRHVARKREACDRWCIDAFGRHGEENMQAWLTVPKEQLLDALELMHIMRHPCADLNKKGNAAVAQMMMAAYARRLIHNLKKLPVADLNENSSYWVDLSELNTAIAEYIEYGGMENIVRIVIHRDRLPYQLSHVFEAKFGAPEGFDDDSEAYGLIKQEFCQEPLCAILDELGWASIIKGRLTAWSRISEHEFASHDPMCCFIMPYDSLSGLWDEYVAYTGKK